MFNIKMATQRFTSLDDFVNARWYDSCHHTIYLFLMKLKAMKHHEGLPRRLNGKNPPASAGDGFSPWLGRSSGEGNGNPLQCSCLENPRDGGAWWAAISRVAQSRT